MIEPRDWLKIAVLCALAGCAPSQTMSSGNSGPEGRAVGDDAVTEQDAGRPPIRRDDDPTRPAPETELDAGSSSSAECGDKLVSDDEQCDDGNAKANDGCDASCQIESGWSCPVVGARCRAAECGDGVIAGDEECEDGDADPLDGCDDRCRLEDGYACGDIGEACHATVCGDGTTEGSEQCDDGANDVPFDGCYACVKEPVCGEQGCAASCGDGIVFPNEACDDGNVRGADGCSPACKLEGGFECTSQTEQPPAFVDLPIIYRDFRGKDLGAIAAAGIAAGHPDFQGSDGSETGIVTNSLSADKKPVYAKTGVSSATTNGATAFDTWYRDDPAYNRTIVDAVRLTRNDAGDYVFFDPSFFPLDARGFVIEGHESLRSGNADETGNAQHNFHFTSELRTWFEYKGGEFLEFKGDDDVWVFVNGKLAVDLGGVHGVETGSVTLDPSGTDARFGITQGNIYEIVVFQAERHTVASQYQLTLRDFVRVTTSCASICGDGVLTPDEACDDGANEGGYGQCAEGCVFGPRCGDGVVQKPQGEECDDQNRNHADGCTNECQSNVIL